MEKKKILVVDDDEKLLMVTSAILEHEGYDVLTHNQAIGTSSIIKSFNPDLVLLDINMPALSGESLADVLLIHKMTSKTKIVFLSSNDEDSLRKSCSSRAVTGYICKGDLFQLRSKVAKYLQA